MRKYIDAEALKHKSIEIPFNGKFHKVIPLGEFDTIPAADVRPVVRGKWKPSMCGTKNGPIQDKDEWYGPLFLCSECGADMIGASNFCPNCGAMMEES